MVSPVLVDLGFVVAKVAIDKDGDVLLTLMHPEGEDVRARSFSAWSSDGSLRTLGLALIQAEDDAQIVRDAPPSDDIPF